MKRIISLLVVLAMVASMLPTVFAAKTEVNMDELLGRLVILDSIDEIAVALDEGPAAKIYQWQPETAGVLNVVFYTSDLPEDAEIDVTMTQGDNSIVYSECDGAFELEVNPDSNVNIIVNKTSEAAVDFTMYGIFLDPYGTEGNPYFLTEMENVVTANADNTWFQGFFSETTMTVTGEANGYCVVVNGEATASVDGVVTMAVETQSPRMPFTFMIDKAGTYTIQFEYPVGHQMNPEILFRPNYIAVDIAEGNDQGYYYKWTSSTDGTLKLTCPAVDGVEYDVILTNMSTYAMAWLSDSEDGTVSIDVKNGDEIIIQVVAVPGEDWVADWTYPALETSLTGEIIFPIGHQMNPDVLFRPAYIAVEIAEGNSQGYYYKWTSNADGTLKLTCPTVDGVEYDVVLTNMSTYAMAWLSESEDGTVSIDMKAGDEIIIQVVAIPDESYNYPALSVALTGEIVYSIGHQMNPEVLSGIDEIAVELAEGNSQGYYYKWISSTDGTLKLTCPAVDGVEYDVVMTNMSTYQQAWLADSEDGTVSVDVKNGDEIIIQVIAVPDETWCYPALETNLTGGLQSEQSAEMTITPDVFRVRAGDSVTFSVSVTPIVNCRSAAILIEKHFDPQIFQFVEGECTLDGTVMGDFDYVDGKLSGYFTYYADEARTISGEIFTFTMRIKDTAPLGGATIGGVANAHVNGEDVPVQVTGATVKILCKHTWGSWITVDDSYHKRACVVCLEEQTALHKWDAGEEIKAPTCEEDGTLLYTCQDCGTTKTEPIVSMDGHKYGAWQNVDGTNHMHICVVCASTETAAHSWDDGKLITEPNYALCYTCVDCGATYTETVVQMTVTPAKNVVNRGDIIEFSVTSTVIEDCRSGSLVVDFDQSVLEFVEGSCTLSGVLMSNFRFVGGKLSGTFAFGSATEISGQVFTFKMKVLDAAALENTVMSFSASARDSGGSVKVVAESVTLCVVCNHSWGDWKNTDPAVHARTCSGCGAVETASHTAASAQMFTGASTHWYECTCGAKVGETAHVYDLSQWESDAASHWHACVCGAKTDETAHEFDETRWETDATHHWHACFCGAKDNHEQHSFTEEIIDDAHRAPGKNNYYYDCADCDTIGTESFLLIERGDVEEDGDVDEDDAIYLLQYILLPDLFPVYQEVDYDKNGQLDEQDALYLLMHVLLPEHFPL